MTEETRKLFSAPWKARECPHVYAVNDARGELKAETLSAVGANRLANLPELYDALVETLYYKCFECMGGLRHNIDLTREELVKNGCPKQNKSNVCIFVKYLELLRKVRNGE